MDRSKRSGIKYGLPQWMSLIWQIVNRPPVVMFSPSLANP
jgi:hypothetical protein